VAHWCSDHLFGRIGCVGGRLFGVNTEVVWKVSYGGIPKISAIICMNEMLTRLRSVTLGFHDPRSQIDYVACIETTPQPCASRVFHIGNTDPAVGII
jgi:hypothetical protein